MVRTTSVLLFLSSTFFLNISARDLSSSAHTHGAHTKRLLQESVEGDEEQQIKVFNEEEDVGVALAKRAALAPSRGQAVTCAALGIPRLDDALIDKIKTNLANTGWDSWVSGTRCVLSLTDGYYLRHKLLELTSVSFRFSSFLKPAPYHTRNPSRQRRNL